MPLTVRAYPGKAGLWIEGYVAGSRIRRRAASDEPALAREQATLLEAEMLRARWHGSRPERYFLGQAVASYLGHRARSDSEKRRLHRLLVHAGNLALDEIDQNLVDRLRAEMLRPGPAPSTVLRELIVPLRAVMQHAHKRRWCDAPVFDIPSQPKGRTAFMLPEQVEQLHAKAAPHLQPLITFLACTGARLGEALAVTWSDYDPIARRLAFQPDITKAEKLRRIVLTPAAVQALHALPNRDGAIFRTQHGVPYAAREGGGHIKTAWAAARRRAALPEHFTPHTLRHSWASWHYALHRDLLKLQVEGGWSSVRLVERYAHLLPEGQARGIRRVWGLGLAGTGPELDDQILPISGASS